MKSLFEIEYVKGEFYLQYDGESIDVFRQGQLAKLRLIEARRIELEANNECPAVKYQEIFKITKEKFEGHKRIMKRNQKAADKYNATRKILYRMTNGFP